MDKKVPARSKDPFDPNRWHKLLDNLSTSVTFLRPKEGRTRLKLYWADPSADEVFYRDVQSIYRGHEKTRYMILAVPFDGPGVTEDMKSKVVPMIVNKTILKALLSLLSEGYDLFSSAEGHGISINRTGTGLDSDYQVVASAKPQAFPEDLEIPTKSIDQFAAEFELWASRNSSREEDEEQPGSSTNRPPW